MNKEERRIYDKKRYQNHRESVIARSQKYYQNHKEEGYIQKRKWRKNHKENWALISRKWYQNHKEEVSILKRKYRQIHKEQINARERERRQKTKKEVLTHYGNGKLVCVRCGFNDIRGLALDHINGDGAVARKLGFVGINLYRYLIKQGYPEGYQTLCMNCNTIKRFIDKEDVLGGTI